MINTWRLKIEQSKKDRKEWLEKSQKVIRRYKDERETGETNVRKFNILWSNTETLKAALFARYGRPDVRRRFGVHDTVGASAATLLERTLEYCADVRDPTDEVDAALFDMLLTGRGVCRVDYEPVFATEIEDVPVGIDEMGMPITMPVERQYVADQKLSVDYVHYADFLHSPARRWDDVEWIAFRHSFSNEDMQENFGEAALDSKATDSVDMDALDKKADPEVSDLYERTTVWEIWDKPSRKRIWLSEGAPDPLRTDDDPLGLDGFFPCPEPLFGPVMTNDDLLPTPEYCIYQDQAEELDRLTMRIARLTEALKRRGVYDAQFKKELGRLADATDNEFIPVDAYAALKEAGGLKGVFSSEEFQGTAQVVVQLMQQRQAQIQQVYEITGISDILRGSTDPRETATAQKIKGRFGSLRLQDRQASVLKFLRNLMRIQAEIIAEHFEPDVLQAAAEDVQVTPEIVAVLRDQKLRDYKIDIETESTMFEDAEAEKQRRMEFIQAITGAFEKWIPAMQAMPQLAPLAIELIGFGVRAFKSGQSLEDVITRTLQSIAMVPAQTALPPTALPPGAGGAPMGVPPAQISSAMPNVVV